MRILLLGGMTSMGHLIYAQIHRDFSHIKVSFKQSATEVMKSGFFNPNHILDRIDILHPKTVEFMLKNFNPDVVVNCTTGTESDAVSFSESEIIEMNSVLPHFLYEWCRQNGAFFVHVTGDDVFDGGDAVYTETSPTDSKTIFGKAMALGEIQGSSALTIRASVFGPEYTGTSGLFSKLALNKDQKIRLGKSGFVSSVSSHYLAQFVADQIKFGFPVEGLIQLASQPISESEFIKLINWHFKWNLTFEYDPTVIHRNKILSHYKLLGRWPEPAPRWSDMIYELASEMQKLPELYASYFKQE